MSTEQPLKPAQPLKIVLAIPHQLLLQGIQQTVNDDEELTVAGGATSWEQVPPLIESAAPDILLLDWDLPEDPLRAIDLVRERHPRVKIVVLSQFDDDGLIHTVLERGASGYLLKTIEASDLPLALRQTAQGVISHGVGGSVASGDAQGRSAGLTSRESAVLGCVARGLANRQIAEELAVTEQTVKFHLTNVYRKLGVPNRLSAARYAYAHSLVEVPPAPISGAGIAPS